MSLLEPPVPPKLATDDQEVLLLVSVDAEEDNWIPARQGVLVENARELPRVNRFLERLGARPTYFVTHSLAVDETAARIVRELSTSDRVEIGAHLHPWNTPPMTESFIPRHTMLLNLPAPLQQAKLQTLTEALTACLHGAPPRAFRAGRWGFGMETVEALLNCGYLVDSSVTPFTSWRGSDEGASYHGAPAKAYRLEAGSDVRRPVSRGRIVEVPLSFGFNRAPLERWATVHKMVSSRVGKALMLDRAFARSGFLRYVTLSPETDTVEDMLALSRALLADGTRHLHMYFHSPTLLPGLTPFARTQADVDRFYAATEEFLQRVTALARIRFATVSEAASLLEPATP